jgi:DNA end-binding protein Ku
VTPKELDLAKRLIEDMTGPWEPNEYEDTYNEDLMARIEEKIKRGETHLLTKPEAEAAEGRTAQVIDLMELLKRSIDKTSERAPARAAKRAPAKTAEAANEGEAAAEEEARPRAAARARKATTASKAAPAERKPATKRKRA